jgi:5'-phosphate synthase pdxT subunit
MVGILALQGGFASHAAVFASLGEETREVRRAVDLSGCDRLVIPGGESTVLTKLLAAGDGPALRAALLEFARDKPVMGTCAGLIMLAGTSDDARVEPFGTLPVRVDRNAWGRQTESFRGPVTLDFGNARGTRDARGDAVEIPDDEPYLATFIRAPRIVEVGEGASVLARLDSGEPVMVRAGKILGLTFHPELTPEDTRIHRYFLSI